MKPKVSVFIATSIDGFIARLDHSLDWLELVATPGEDYGYQDFYQSVDALVMGRKTYEKILTFPDYPFHDKTVIVLSSQRNLQARYNEEFYSGHLQTLMKDLYERQIRHVYLDGGVTISHALEAGLVDQLILSRVPVTLGAGIPLFQPCSAEQLWELASVKGYASGLVQVKYNKK